jgi:hypothetical protein
MPNETPPMPQDGTHPSTWMPQQPGGPGPAPLAPMPTRTTPPAGEPTPAENHNPDDDYTGTTDTLYLQTGRLHSGPPYPTPGIEKS